jgi:hypothetical protein
LKPALQNTFRRSQGGIRMCAGARKLRSLKMQGIHTKRNAKRALDAACDTASDRSSASDCRGGSAEASAARAGMSSRRAPAASAAAPTRR